MDNGMLAIIIIGITCVSFLWEKVPLSITALLAALAMGLFKLMPLKEVYAGFASETFIMVMGMMIIGDCLFATGLANVLGKKLVNTPIASNERVFIAVIMTMAGISSAFLSNSAVVATFIPLSAAMVAKSGGRLKNKFIVMGIGMAAALGGAGTIVGSTSQLVAQSILKATDGVRTMTFFELGYVVFPMLAVLIIYMSTIGYSMMQKRFKHIDDLNLDTSSDSAEIEAGNVKVTFQMWVAGLVILGCIVGFIFEIWNVAVIALLGATICIACGCKPFKKAFAELDWNTLVILAAAQGFAKGLDVSGGGKIISSFTLDLFGGTAANPMILMVLGIVLSSALTSFMSNTALAAMLTPIFINIGFALGVDPLPFVIGTVIGGSTDLFTPIGTPAMTQTLVAGYRFTDYVYIGLPITIILTAMAAVLCPIVYGITPLVR